MTNYITGGKVTFEDAVKHEGYNEPQFAPSRRAAVELAFDVPEGADGKEVLDTTFDTAVAKVYEILGKKPAKQSAKDGYDATVKVTGSTRKAKDKPATEAVVDTSPAGSDKAALEAAAGLTASQVVEAVVKAIEPETDSLDDLLGEAAPVPITDAELAKAAQNKNAQMKVSDPNFSVKIRALVVEYAGAPPKKITDVPVAKRQEFLDKLRELK